MRIEVRAELGRLGLAWPAPAVAASRPGRGAREDGDGLQAGELERRALQERRRCAARSRSRARHGAEAGRLRPARDGGRGRPTADGGRVPDLRLLHHRRPAGAGDPRRLQARRVRSEDVHAEARVQGRQPRAAPGRAPLGPAGRHLDEHALPPHRQRHHGGRLSATAPTCSRSCRRWRPSSIRS